MTKQSSTKRAESKPAKTLDQMEKQAQEVRDSLAKALVQGDPTAALREFLCELESELAVEKQRVTAEQQRIAAEQAAHQAAQTKSAAVQKFEAQHPGAVRLINEANERRRALVESFRV